jgi:hypothetical protein
MRGPELSQSSMFSYLSIEDRIPQDHPLRSMRRLLDPVLTELSPRFSALYSNTGRPSIPPEQLLRALLLQILYTIRSERQLMEQLDYNLLFRWFVGLNPDDPIWVPRFSRRTETGCWTAILPRRFSTRCLSTRTPTRFCRMSTSPLMAHSSKRGQVTRASAQ